MRYLTTFYFAREPVPDDTRLLLLLMMGVVSYLLEIVLFKDSFALVLVGCYYLAAYLGEKNYSGFSSLRAFGDITPIAFGDKIAFALCFPWLLLRFGAYDYIATAWLKPWGPLMGSNPSATFDEYLFFLTIFAALGLLLTTYAAAT